MQMVFPDFSGLTSSLPVSPDAVVWSQPFWMAQLHLDAARTSICGCGRGFLTASFFKVTLPHRHKSAFIHPSVRWTRHRRSRITKAGRHHTVFPDWLRLPHAGRRRADMTQGKVGACIEFRYSAHLCYVHAISVRGPRIIKKHVDSSASILPFGSMQLLCSCHQ